MRSLLTGLLLICLGSVAFMGCSDNQTLANLVPSQLTGAIAPPKAAPAGSTVLITPTDANGTPTGAAVATPVAAVSDGLKLESPSMTFTASTTVAGQQPSIVVEVLNAVGQQVGVSAPISLAQVGNGLATGAINIPVNAGGSYRIALAAGTSIQVANVAGMTRANIPQNLAIGIVDVLFNIEFVGGVFQSSTIPVDWTLNLTKSGDYFKLADSTMAVYWNAALGSKAPTDGKAKLTLTMRKDGAAAGTASQTANIANSIANFSGASQAPFNAVDITLDVRNSK